MKTIKCWWKKSKYKMFPPWQGEGDQTDLRPRATPGRAWREKMSEHGSWQTHFTTMCPRGPSFLPGKQRWWENPWLSAPPKHAGGGPGQAVKTSWNVLLHSLCWTAFVRHWGAPSVWYFNPMVLKMRILRSDSTAPQLNPGLEKAELGMDPEPLKAYLVALALWKKAGKDG